MEYRQLGSSDLKVSVVSFGCWAMGKQGWGDVQDEETIAAVHRALDLGINLFDTADIYGFGHSEEVLARALEGHRKEVIVATKVGNRWDEATGKTWPDLSRSYITKAVENSLRRLRTDVIDLYQVHLPDPKTPAEETMGTLLDLQRAGKIRWIGVSNFSPEQIREFLRYGPVVSLQPPLSLFVRHAEVQLLPLCQEQNIGVITYSPLAMGLLTGKYDGPIEFPEGDFRRGNSLFQGRTFERNIAVVKRLKAFAERHGRTVTQLAVAWVLAHPAVTSAICGAKRPPQIEESAAAWDWKLSYQQLKEIDRILVETQV